MIMGDTTVQMITWWTLLTLINVVIFSELSTSSNTRLIVTSPVNPVREGALLSIHCQIWGLERRHQVSLLRKLDNQDSDDGLVEILSVNEDILSAVDDKVYLAVRHLPDGSAVYFLSIVQLGKLSDEGQYYCKVEKPATAVHEADEIVAVDSVIIQVLNFPAKISSPKCVTQSPMMKVTSGDTVLMNCSTEISTPVVTIEWSRAGSSEEAMIGETKQEVRAEHRVTFSVLRVSVRPQDDGAVFICQISSRTFPGRIQTCHLGPFTVLANPDQEPLWPYTTTVNSPSTEVSPSSNVYTKSICQKTCSSSSIFSPNNNYFWIMIFSATGFLALSLLTMSVLLSTSYCHARRLLSLTQTRSSSFKGYPMEDIDIIYSELDMKPGVGGGGKDGDGGRRVYMTLELREKLQSSAHCHDETVSPP